SLLGVIGGDVSARALGATPDMQALMHGYLLINFGLFIFVFAVDQLVATMQGAGDTRTPMIAVTIVNTLHILIAYPLIYGRWGAPALGVNGAALAIGLSESVGSIYLYAKARRAGHLIPLFGRHTGPPPVSSLRHILRVGWPITFDRLLQQGAQLAYARIILGYGAVVYAAHQVGMNIEALSFMPGNGFAVAAVTAVGQSIGAQKLAKAKIENWEANRLAVLLMAGMGLLFFCFPYLLLRAFTTDAAVIGYGTLFLKIVGMLQIPLAITMVLSGSLKGAGDTRFLLLVTAIGAWLVRVPLAAIFSGLGLTIGWVWSVMLVDWTTRMGCLIWRYRSEHWQRLPAINRTSD
ncbi:MAG TPA: MATE family efflux transporter, partial [Nitrospiria bacterium]|nr:MATE family efflux transporter [Nitrospiria bacterium]